MISRRLLMGGGGSFPTPPSAGDGVLTFGTPFDITNDTKSNTLPSACVLANGDWLLVYVKSDDFEVTKGVIVGKLSSNEGASWGTEFSVVSDGTLTTLNPAVCTMPSGRVVLAYNLFDHTGPSTAADAVRVIYSDDPETGGSATWSSPYTVNAAFSGYCANGTSRPVVLPDETVLLPVYGDSGAQTSSQVFFSTDDGATFGGAVTMANGPGDGRNYYEPSIARLSDGTLIGQYRTSGGTGTIYQNESTDDGATWNAPATAFGGYSTTNIIERVTTTIVGIVRDNATALPQAWTSIDSGASWDDQGDIQATGTIMIYGLWLDRLDNTGFVIYSIQPSGAGTNADIRGCAVTEGP